MKDMLTWKSALTTIVISIVGSALWETMFRDLLNFIGRTLLTISTLGVEKYKDDIYINIAKGFYEQVSITILILSLGAIMSGTFGIITAASSIRIKENCDGKKVIEKYLWIKWDWIIKHQKSIMVVFILYTITAGIVLTITTNKIIYINKSIAYFKQLESIASPYISVDQEKIFNSRFAQIKNKGDYVQIIDDLEKVITDANQSLPESPVFIF